MQSEDFFQRLVWGGGGGVGVGWGGVAIAMTAQSIQSFIILVQ